MLSCLLAAAILSPLQTTLDKLHAGGKFPGITAAVVLPNGELITAASGFADPATGRKMKPNDRMLAGSVGKMFVGAYAAILVQEGRLQLDDLVFPHLSKLEGIAEVPNARTVTFRQLLHHQSGIPEHVQSEDFIRAIRKEPIRKWRPAELIAFVRGKKPLFEPGAAWEYADTNYVIAGAAMEAITGKPLFSEIEARIIRPMKLSASAPQRGRRIRGLIVGHQRAGSPFGPPGPVIQNGQLPFDPEMEYAGGGIVTCSADLAQFAKKLYNAPYSSVMKSGVPCTLGPGQKYGIGTQIRPSKFGTSFGHSGWFPGYITDVEYFPDSNTAVAIQINSDDVRSFGMRTSKMISEIMESISAGAK